ncbi:MAG: hypothetical protein ACI857_002071 [Arenicella sp.]|jgi:hypothetical protein
MNKEPYETDYAKLEFIEGVLRGTFKAKKVTIDIAYKIVEDRLMYSNNESVVILISDVGLRSIDREARDYLSSDQGLAGLKASALLTNSALSKHLANFFVSITVRRPVIPTKVFSNETEAIEWLKQYI